MVLEVVRFEDILPLSAHAGAWDRLAGDVPFRTWSWLGTWWRHYGLPGDLYVLGVFDGRELIGVAPWYRTDTAHGRTLRLMGDTEVCSEYETVLSRPGMEHAVAEALAHRLAHAEGPDRWDLLELSPVAPGDPVLEPLCRRLSATGCRLHTRPGIRCWRISLAETWEDYLATLSKNRRKKVRQLWRRYVDSGRAVLRSVNDLGELRHAQGILFDLHQRRRSSLGEAGCFLRPRFAAFHFEVMELLLHQSQLGLHWVELDGRPVAAEYDLLGGRAVHSYQGGILPDSAGDSPGQLATLLVLKQAIDRGYRTFDFLRGDEKYKQSWGAGPQQQVEIRIVADRTVCRIRHGAWLVGVEARQWIAGAIGAMHRS